MIEETHSLKCQYKGVQPYVKVTAYELSAVDCSADRMSGYYGQESTLISNDPPLGYDFANWSVTGSNVTGNNVTFRGDITAKANYSAHKYNVTLQNDGHGTIAASKTTGNIGDTITLSNTPATHYHFDHYATTGATLTGSQFKFNASDVTAKGFFAADPSYSVTLQTDGHGKIVANKTTGYAGDTITLSNTASAGYGFKNYTVTGATINGSTLTFGNGNCTAKANYSAVTGGPFTARIVFDKHGRANDPHVCIVSAQPSLTANFAISNLFVTANTQYTYEDWTTAYVFNSAHKVNNLSISYTGAGSAVGGNIKHVLQINDSVRFSAIGNNLATVTFTGTANNVTLKSMGSPYYMYTYPNAEFINNNNIYWSTIGSATAIITGVLV